MLGTNNSSLYSCFEWRSASAMRKPQPFPPTGRARLQPLRERDLAGGAAPSQTASAHLIKSARSQNKTSKVKDQIARRRELIPPAPVVVGLLIPRALETQFRTQLD